MTAELQYLHRALINAWMKFMMLFLICAGLNYMRLVYLRDHMSPCAMLPQLLSVERLTPDTFGIKEGKKISELSARLTH